MIIQNVVFTLVILILASLIAEPLARWARIPFVAVLVLIGFLGSEWVVFMGHDTGIRAHHFNDLVFQVFLPVIIFESAYRINQKALLLALRPVLMLAMPILLLSIVLAAWLLYLGIGHPTGFPVMSALVAAVILMSTDPLAVVSHLRKTKAPEDITTIIEGESLFNDAIAIVLYTSIIGVAILSQTGDGSSMFEISVMLSAFFWQFFIGLLIGTIGGLIGMFMSYVIETRILENVLLLALAYGCFLITEQFAGASGVMAVLAAGLIMNKAHQHFIPPKDLKYIHYWWDVISFIATAMLFILLGLTVTTDMFSGRWLAMLIAIAAVILTRAIAVYGALPLLNFKGRKPLPGAHQHLLFWGSTRGAITAALALSLPTELEGWWTIQSMAFGVILFTLFVQAPTVPRLIKPTQYANQINLLQAKRKG